MKCLNFINIVLMVVAFVLIFAFGFGSGATYVIDRINEHSICEVIENQKHCIYDEGFL